MSEPSIDVVDRLVELFPQLAPLLREHLADNFGEVLPHVFFGDLTRHLTSAFARRQDGGTVQPMLDELELAFVEGDAGVKDLIVASFLENLPRTGDDGAGIRDLLGPHLRKELRRLSSAAAPGFGVLRRPNPGGGS